MDRRVSIKLITLGTMAPASLVERLGEGTASRAAALESDWHRWPDVQWTGPAYWGNRLQDWQVRDGQAECRVRAANRSLHCLTHRLREAPEGFETAVTVTLLGQHTPAEGDYVGFRLGARGPFDDYRSAAVFGEGLDAGLTPGGQLFIGAARSADRAATGQPLRLRLKALPQPTGYLLVLDALAEGGATPLLSVHAEGVAAETLVGNAALVSHFTGDTPGSSSGPAARFSGWTLKGAKVFADPAAAFGPVCFALYTLHRGTLKLTAQLTPIEEISGHEVALEIKAGGRWRALATSAVDALSRTVPFRVEGWAHTQDIPYRVRVTLPLQGGDEDFYYEGTIAQEPVASDALRVAVFSCNADYGFPDADVVRHAGKHRPHLAVFLGDQFYESTGGFGIQRAPLEEAVLDMLRKWYLFGWSYRDLFRHIPAAVIPDDHDVYHGNVWGMAGKEAPTDVDWGYAAQDQGGYKMPPAWVNAVQRAQTSHLPDPYDPTPVARGIGVYYTGWTYAGVSFAILEDRKFKTAPKTVLPPEARVENGFITNPGFDLAAHRHVPGAVLLGERQRAFLEAWAEDWSGGVQMKAVLSQTNFCAVHTLPAGATSDKMVPELPLPAPGAYVEGDAPVADMDTNGWPAEKRDEAVRLLRKAFAFHIAGDQHLATVVQYGVDAFADAGFAFTGPALNNLWPRRWWPPQEIKQYPLAGKPAYTGGFFDAFGNRLTVHAVANPHETGLEPSILYDRRTGYGLVTFDKQARTIEVACWPRQVDPEVNPAGQFEGWPLTLRQADNYGREAVAFLPALRITGLEAPVVQIVDEAEGEVVYTLRLSGPSHRPGVFREGIYTVKVGDGSRWLQTRQGIASLAAGQSETLAIDVASRDG